MVLDGQSREETSFDKITTVTEKSCSERLLRSTSIRLISDSGAFTLSERKPNIIKEMYF